MSDEIWSSELDDKFYCRVRRKDGYVGQLQIWEIGKPETLLLDEEVGLMYGAPFGPDISDVMAWQHKCCEVIDAI